MSEPSNKVKSAGPEDREAILASRNAKKLLKQAKKTKSKQEPPAETTIVGNKDSEKKPSITKNESSSASKENKISPNAGQAAAQQLPKNEGSTPGATPQEGKKTTKEMTKAERRALQEKQRAMKAGEKAAAHNKKSVGNVKEKKSSSPSAPPPVEKKVKEKSVQQSAKIMHSPHSKVKLFNHIESARLDMSSFINNSQIHPTIARLGQQYSQRTIIGSNARCIAFLNALKMLIQDFETPNKKEFSRSIEASIKVSVEYLQSCRPLSVSVVNAYKFVKQVLTHLSTDSTESKLKDDLCRFIDTYLENQVGKAAQAISDSMQEKISDGDVILTFGCSSLIYFICEEAHKRNVDFRVIIADSRPFCEGRELLRRLSGIGISCSYILINAVAFVMPEATKVLLGAHALLSNGYVMARTGTAQVALVAQSYNVPVLVCCETHKFSERFQTDAIVCNELGNPNDLILSDKCCLTNWQNKPSMTPLNLLYDITPPQLVTAVVTEVSILPCTSVPVILRIKPTEISYYC